MTIYDRQLAEIEELYNRQRHSGRQMLKALRHNDYGTLHKPRPEGQGFDLMKAENQMRDLDRRGVLTRGQSEAAWAKLRALRPTQVLRVR